MVMRASTVVSHIPLTRGQDVVAAPTRAHVVAASVPPLSRPSGHLPRWVRMPTEHVAGIECYRLSRRAYASLGSPPPS